MIGVRVGDNGSCVDIRVEWFGSIKAVDVSADGRIIVTCIPACPSVVLFMWISFSPYINKIKAGCEAMKDMIGMLLRGRVTAMFI